MVTEVLPSIAKRIASGASHLHHLCLRVLQTPASTGSVTQPSWSSVEDHSHELDILTLQPELRDLSSKHLAGERDKISSIVHMWCQDPRLAIEKGGRLHHATNQDRRKRTLLERRFHGGRIGIITKEKSPGPRGTARKQHSRMFPF